MMDINLIIISFIVAWVFDSVFETIYLERYLRRIEKGFAEELRLLKQDLDGIDLNLDTNLHDLYERVSELEK